MTEHTTPPVMEDANVNQVPTEPPYMRTFSSFCGADMTVLCNGIIIGEVQNIEYKETLGFITGEPPIKGFVDVVIFNDEPSIRSAIKHGKVIGTKEKTLRIYAADEFGNRMLVDFVDVEFTERVGSVSIDTVIPVEKYHFTAQDIVFYQKHEFSVKSDDCMNLEVTIHATV